MLSANMEPMVWGELVLEFQQMLKDQERQEPALTYLNNSGNILRTDRVQPEITKKFAHLQKVTSGGQNDDFRPLTYIYPWGEGHGVLGQICDIPRP